LIDHFNLHKEGIDMNVQDPSRRHWLHGAAAGCVVYSVSALVGCGKADDSAERNTAADRPGSATTKDSPAPAQGAPAVAEANKISKEQAQYQPNPKGDQQCSNCLHFVSADNSCKLVAGTVDASGWSILWAAKS
jgi:hypothetical protein